MKYGALNSLMCTLGVTLHAFLIEYIASETARVLLLYLLNIYIYIYYTTIYHIISHINTYIRKLIRQYICLSVHPRKINCRSKDITATRSMLSIALQKWFFDVPITRK